jgi:outer membrane protein assembly factor BamB
VLASITRALRTLAILLVLAAVVIGLGIMGWKHYDTRKDWPGGFDPATLPEAPQQLRFGLIGRPVELPLRAASRLPAAAKSKIEFVVCNDPAFRFTQLAAGRLDATITTLDELSQACGHLSPGVVVFPLAENLGTDIVVSNKPGVTNSTLVSYVGGGTSEALVRAMPGSNLTAVAAETPAIALKWLNEGRTQAASLWSPYSDQALAKGCIKLYDGKQRPTKEVLLVSQQALKNPAKLAALENLSQSWFNLIDQFQGQSDLPIKAIATENGISPEEVKGSLKDLKFLSLSVLQSQFDTMPSQIQKSVETDLNFWALAGATSKEVDLSNLVQTSLLEHLLTGGTTPSNPSPESSPSPLTSGTDPSSPTSSPSKISSTGPAVTLGGDASRQGISPGPAFREFSALAFQVATGGELQGPPVIHNDLVIIGCEDNKVRALDTLSGAEKWSFQAADSFHSSAAVDDRSVAIGGTDGSLYSLERGTGKKEWAYPSQGEIVGAPVLETERIFAANRSGQVFCVTRAGEEQWKVTLPGNITASPSVADSTLVIGCYDGQVYGLDTDTGKTRWKFKTRGVVPAQAALIDHKVLVGSQDRNLYCLNLEDGTQIWKHATEGQLLQPPAVQDGIVCVGSADTKLYALSLTDGNEIWKYPTRERISSGAVICEDIVYIGSEDKHLYGFRLKDGSRLVKYAAEGWIGTPWIVDKRAYFGCSDGKLYCIK